MKNKNKKKATFFKDALKTVNPKKSEELSKKYMKIQDKSYCRGKKKG